MRESSTAAVRSAEVRVAIVVLGDLGRSPRMQYHALALADQRAQVDIIAYAGTPAYGRLRSHPRIHCHTLRAPRAGGLPLAAPLFFAAGILRVVTQSAQLLRLLLTVPKPDFILLQTPPAIPTLLVAPLAAHIRSAKLVIDWHNFGYAMLALRLGRGHVVVRVARWCERMLGRRGDAHFCVSRAMAGALDAWGIPAVVLYDRPAEMFAPTAEAQRHELFDRLGQELGIPSLADNAGGRPAVIISPTSWTADEDFALLLEAAARCEELTHMRCDDTDARPFPRLLILLTGDGPLRKRYEAELNRRALRTIDIRTAWLSPEDYPRLLGAADLGLCLHRSASGLDLPMKLADMTGAGLPACALNYGPCLSEQIEHGRNGLTFSTSTELAQQLFDLFKDFPRNATLLDGLRQNLAARPVPRWSDTWRAQAQRMFFPA